MTLKDKKNKSEYNRKLKAEGGASAANKGQEKASSSKKDGKLLKMIKLPASREPKRILPDY